MTQGGPPPGAGLPCQPVGWLGEGLAGVPMPLPDCLLDESRAIGGGRQVRRRVWQWSVAVWGALVIAGGLLTLGLQSGDGDGTADPGSGTSDRPVSTSTDIPCPIPSEEEQEEENTVISCYLGDR